LYRWGKQSGSHHPGFKTGLPKKDAEKMKDKPEIVERFKAIVTEILGQIID